MPDGICPPGPRIGQGVLLATDMNGMTAYDAPSAKQLWSISTKQARHHCSAFLRVPVIAASGLVLMPEASSGCGCPYNFQTTITLMPAGPKAPLTPACLSRKTDQRANKHVSRGRIIR